MPLITVWNAGEWYTAIRNAIRDACLGIKELELESATDVTVCFVPDLGDPDWGPIIIMVELIFDRKERTREVRHRLAGAIAQAVKRSTLGHDRTIQVAVKHFNAERDAFWTE